MVRSQIEQEIFAFAEDPIPHRHSPPDRLSELIDLPSVERHLIDIYTAANGEPALSNAGPVPGPAGMTFPMPGWQRL